jgi:hypothetical protein
MASETTGVQVEQVAPVSDVQATPVQEQTTATTPSLTPEQIEAALSSEAAQRKIQSETDKRFAKFQAEQLRLQREQEAQRKANEARAAEEAQMAEMDDAEYGAHMRQKTQTQEAAQAQALERDRLHYQAALELLPADEQPAMMERARNSEFKSETEFIAAIADRRAELRTPKNTETIREAARREATAEVANAGSPTLGASLPRQTVDLSKMSSDQLLSAGMREEMEKVKKR